MTATAAFKANKADLLYSAPITQIAALKSDERYIVIGKKLVAVGVVGDSKNPKSPFSKLKVRQAVSHAIDNQTICDTILQGLMPPSNQAAALGCWGYNPKVTGYPYDPEKAKQLLAEAGYPDGFKTKLWFVNLPPSTKIFTSAQGYLAEVGIMAELGKLDISGWLQKLRKGWPEGDMCYVGMGQANPDDTRNPECKPEHQINKLGQIDQSQRA